MWRKTLILPHNNIKDAIEVIDKSSLQIALVVDENSRLLGTITDGDIRRAILKGVSLDESIENVMNSKPIYATIRDSRNRIFSIMKNKRIHHIPVLDDDGKILKVEFIDDFIQPSKLDNVVVIMAGGLGSRLRPLTENIPKPMLKVGDKPILETIIESFIDQGFYNFYLSVNYKAEMVIEYFGDGSKWNANIHYIMEDKRLGTAGALALLPEDIDKPIIVMNGDLLTKVNFQLLLDFHKENNVEATMCVREYHFEIPYGVVKVEKQNLISIEEKPIHRSFVNAGIYVVNPSVIEYIPKNDYYDMPNLFTTLVENKIATGAFPIREYWLDIGQHEDYQRANGEYEEVFK